MQKGKLIIAGIVLTLSPALYAADTAEIIPAQQVVQSEGTPPLSDVSPMQDHVVEMIEKDFNFESQYRELANQLALEKSAASCVSCAVRKRRIAQRLCR